MLRELGMLLERMGEEERRSLLTEGFLIALHRSAHPSTPAVSPIRNDNPRASRLSFAESA